MPLADTIMKHVSRCKGPRGSLQPISFNHVTASTHPQVRHVQPPPPRPQPSSPLIPPRRLPLMVSLCPTSSLLPTLRGSPPSLADATSARPSIPVSPRHARRTALSSCQDAVRDHISPDSHPTVLGPSFVRFPIGFSFRIPALPLLLSIFYLAIGHRTRALPLLA